tara:strand:- start:467 stop:1435 length:969 start_codon:yes stop_codon:yes gene_type:complete
MTALATGVGALGLGGLAEEETGTGGGFKQRPYPEGEMRAGMGLVDGMAFNLNDDEERAEYFRRVRERQGFKDKDEDKDKNEDEVSTDPIRAYRGGFFPRPGLQQQMGPSGLQQFGQQIGKTIQEPVAETLQEIPAFLNEVESMAEERFGVELGGTNPTGGGLNQMGVPLPSSEDNIANLFDQMQTRIGQDRGGQTDLFAPKLPRRGPELQYVGQDMGGGIDQFGKQMRALPAPVMPISGGLSPFGGGQSRTLAGLGAMGNLFMMDGGEVNGPGTGTSDSVPARLSDGEFVLTAKAVRGAGNGDRDIGAARMYEMMSELERMA